MAINAMITQVNITTLNTAQQLTSVRGAAGGIGIKALPANTGTVWLKEDNTVSATTGWPLAAGESIVLDIKQSSKLWVYGAANDRVAIASVGN
jgi:hypothetical protein